MTITQFWGGTCAVGFGRAAAAALSCALLMSTPACNGSDKRIVSVKPPEPPEPPEPDADTPTGMGDIPDGSLPCVFDAKYLAAHRACSVDADCAEFTYEVTCCPDAESLLVAVAKSELEQVQACADVSKLMCGNCPNALTRAEDGRVVSEQSLATVQCVERQCVSSVGPRDCGSRMTCGAHEICVTYQNVPDGIQPDPDSPDNKLLTFSCVPNPCQGELDCDCVQPICDARNDTERKCEIKHNGESDVTCTAVQN